MLQAFPLRQSHNGIVGLKCNLSWLRIKPWRVNDIAQIKEKHFFGYNELIKPVKENFKLSL